ncbi:exodeoxyribonuclease VII large subunit [Fundidesulfovibrio terrae]|uniref:exodeoxyribonuclease VII large subunit n=1 Tax=Fundidesulfovibrio terrae TaxID=2922866 RepID=UPI001FAE9B72|nr:exodeoxyribonuclease VII large subunit [Fundidesulfovibrio terrae]
MQHIFRVGEITRALKDVVEGQFPFVWVRGQVSNLARPASGHVYFSLKDEEAVLNVVWFKGSQSGVTLNGSERYDPLTGEVMDGPADSSWLADGADVLCAGRLTVYAPRGAYQLVAELVQDMGLGRLYMEFEALKQRMGAQGLFAPERKRPLPANPRRVAVVTAPTGAAIRDFLRVANARGTGCEVRIFPALVQGEAAPGQIAEALDAAASDGWAEVVVLTRGGGSIEDLWAFNTEAVAQAVFKSSVPVLTGVGHEVDTTIADLVADVRAATPSHAAQLLWPDRAVLAQRADELDMRLNQAFSRFTRGKAERLEALAKALSWLSPRGKVDRLGERLDDLCGRLARSGRALAAGPQGALGMLEARLARAGQALPAQGEARLDGLERRLSAFGPAWIEALGTRLEAAASRLQPTGERCLERSAARLDLMAARLAGLDPEAPLDRGYVMARKADGTFLRRVDEVRPGDALDIVVRDGTVKTAVSGVEKNRK